MAAALSAITANLNPKEWVKTTSAEENALSFEKWIEQYERWESICCGGLGHTPTQRWNLLLSVGGSEIVDLATQAKIQIKAVDPIDPVAAQEEQDEVRDAQGNVTQQHRPAVRAVIGRNAKLPTDWDEGIQAIKDAISKYSNQIMARHKLMFLMPASDYSDWRKWGQELLEQAKRCKWEEYTAEVAALDALLYQCPNQQWKDKIMEGTMNVQECIDWGMSKWAAKEQGKIIGDKSVKADSTTLPVDRVEEKKLFDCKKCFQKHELRNCPAWNQQCSKCQRWNHLANSRECKNQAPPGGDGRGRGRWQQRGQRGRGRGDNRGRRGGPPDLSHERGGDRGYYQRDNRSQQRTSGDKTVYVPTKDGGLKKTTVAYLTEQGSQHQSDRGYDRDYGYDDRYGRDDRYDDRYNDGYDDYDIPCDRLTLGRIKTEREYVDVMATPTNNATYYTKIRWTADTGAPKTMLSEKDFCWILAKNPDVKIRHSNMRFRPYSTRKLVPLIGECDMRLTNEENKAVKTTVYIVEGEKESLLGKEDAIQLGIIKVNPRGDKPSGTDDIGCITPEILQEPIKDGIVSGGQTQSQIDAKMDEIAEKHASVFQGMGRANTEPIHIEIEDDAIPVAQGRRPIPHQLREAAQEKLKYLLDNDLIEGPLPAEECKGWIHNIVVTKKGWSSSEVRINVDTKKMNQYIIKKTIPIPTTEDLRHNLEGSDRFTALDCTDSFHFLLDEVSKDLFKFYGIDGV